MTGTIATDNFRKGLVAVLTETFEKVEAFI